MHDPLTGLDWRLSRFPDDHDKSLRAWDTADQYLIDHCRGEGWLDGSPRVLLINDAFGALAVSLNDLWPTSWSDSVLGRQALRRNLRANGLDPEDVEFIGADRDPSGTFDLILLKFPKSLSWHQDALLRLRPHLHADSRIVSGGMIKHSPKRAYTLLETCLGPTRTSRGWKKARLAFSEFDPALDLPPGLPESVYELEGFDLQLRNRANAYSRESLDIGTRYLLPHLPSGDAPLQAADLGCGNGALSLALARNCPRASILGTDESYQAVAAARDNAALADLDNPDLRFDVADCLGDTPDESLDLVLCNPPFHQAQTVTDHIARRMFGDAHRALKIGGELMIVGNAHLGYRDRLLEIFDSCETLATDKKFVVLKATKNR